MKKTLLLVFISVVLGQVQYNHPEINWKTIETSHFRIHFYSDTENSAREGAKIAENIYDSVTKLYSYEPFDKTDIVFTDVDDISNGAAYFYDNKIIIWTSPLDFELRGSHRWLQNVITHEFTHIVSIQRAQKFGKSVPAGYFQWIGYEKEKRPDVLYGYPNMLVSYPLPATNVPPWLAEGVAQYMYPGADWDNWDSIRDMILRDRIMTNNMLSWREMNTFGKSGIGNESVYNAGFALSKYLAVKYKPEILKEIMISLSKPFNYSINNAIKDATGKNGEQVFSDFLSVLETRYNELSSTIVKNSYNGRIIENKGTSNLFPVWNDKGNLIAYLSNQDNDYFTDTNLYLYDINKNTSTSIVDGVTSKPSWNNNIIYYSKKSKNPNKVGSRFYDLYEYNIATKKEGRLTYDSRAFSPVFNEVDSTLFFMATYDGTQNIYMIDLHTKLTQQLTDYSDQEIIGGLNYDIETNYIVYDITTNHFRDILYLNLSDSTTGSILNSNLWDERQSDFLGREMVYTDDRSGIFNLYFIGEKNQGYLTNVLGGAFMPDIHESGKIAYSLYQNGKYNIAILDSIKLIDDSDVGYSPLYFQRNNNLPAPMNSENNFESKKYNDHFPPMMTMPRITIDYGTFKPGIYFYSSEILDKVSIMGGASMNAHRDLDLFFLFEYRHLFPTLFFETFYLTRNIEDQSVYSAYKIDNNLKFRLIEFRSGIKLPIYGTELEIYGSWSRYRASIKENIIGQPQIQSGIAYDYFNGKKIGFDWQLKRYKRRIDQNINPVGFNLNLSLANEWNEFIDGIDLSNSGTLISKYKDHNLIRGNITGQYLWEIPGSNRWTISAKGQLGWLSDAEVDSFFHFFGGGMPGLKGYPYYSIEGSNMMIYDLGFRIPLFREKHFPIGWFTLQHSTLGIISQFGDAWNRNESEYSLKRSRGIEWRLSGYSFYNYSTSLSLEYHQGIDKFTMDIGDGIPINYGKKGRYYLSVLFGF